MASEFDTYFRELVLNWKLRLVVSALFSILGLAILISTISGYIMENFAILDQSIVGVSVFVIVIPVYLIIADLPKIDRSDLAEILNDTVPELENGAELALMPESERTSTEQEKLERIRPILEDEKLYRHLPNYPITQAAILMGICLILTALVYFYFH